MHSKAYWKSSRRPQPTDTGQAAVGIAPSSAATVVAEPVSPYVRQLISQADSLNEISRRVESQMKREGIPVLAATRAFVEFASARGGTSTLTRNDRRAPVDTRPQYEIDDDVDAGVDPISDYSDLQPNQPPAFRAPFFNQAPPAVEPPSPLPVDDVPYLNGASAREYNLDVAPFPILSGESQEHTVDTPKAFAETGDPQAAASDHVLADWIDPKEFHGNDRARAYDIDPEIETDPFQVPAFTASTTPAAVEGEIADGVSTASAAVDAAVETTQEVRVDDAAVELARNAPLTDVLDKISNQYRNRAQSAAGARAQSDLADAALEPDVAVTQPEVKRSVPGQIAHPYMVTVHGNLEIPKVPPYIWSAPELPWDRDDVQDPMGAWFNCMGNRYQLALEF